jgi:Pyruvate/2-oxoacid:ferredoxin oxidoreductase delta subunit
MLPTIDEQSYYQQMTEICAEQGDYISAQMFREKLAGDKIRFERDRHSDYCLGCPICFNPVLDAEI